MTRPAGEPAASVAFAPAKINLYLHVLGRRADGFHLLDSLVVFAGIGDELACSLAPTFCLEVDGPAAKDLPPADENLVSRAALGLAAAMGRAPGAHVRLTKLLPVASGIGGGSADAAAALRALDRLWGLDLGERKLAELGLALGSDLPVCLRGRPTAVSGIGELPADVPPLPPAWFALINPGVAVPTREVFARRRGPFSTPAPFHRALAGTHELAALLRERRNDLTAPACEIAPGIGEVLAALEAAPGCLLARMSGSGATCFGLFAAPGPAEEAAATIGRAQPGWWCVAAPMLG